MTTEDLSGRPPRRRAFPGWKAVRSIGATAPSPVDRRRLESSPRGHLEVAGVGWSDGDDDVLVDLSFELPAGSTAYLSTTTRPERSALLSVLLGVSRPTQGSITLDGRDLGDLPLAERRADVTIALNDPWVVEGTIASNISFGWDVSRQEIEMAAKLACVDAFADLDACVANDGPELTVGQRRLIGLARAVVRHPAVVLVEEPTTGLDARTETLVIRALQRVSEGRTTVIATPRRHLIRPDDREIRIERGRLVATRLEAVPDPEPVEEPVAAPAATQGTESLWAITTGDEVAPGFRAVSLRERSPHTETWLAWDTQGARSVEVKIPRRKPTTHVATDELAREYRTADLLRHPGLAKPLSADFDRARPYAVYEHLEGRTLADVIGTHIDLPDPALVLRIGYDLARTLGYLHQRGYAHLDLRPEIVTTCPEGTIITDLKMAVPLGHEQVRFYRQDQYGVLAAEQLRGAPASAAMDMFALGSLLFQATHGVLATDTSQAFGQDRHKIDSRPPRRRPHGPLPLADPGRQSSDTGRAVEELIERLTASDPDGRPNAVETVALIRPHLLAPGANPVDDWIRAAS